MYHLGQYDPGRSLVHRLDPRIKILFTILLSVLILQTGMRTGIFFTLFLGSVFFVSGIAFGRLWQALKPALLFFAFLFLLHLFFTPGRPLLPWFSGAFAPTREGLLLGALTTLRFILLIVCAALLTGTTLPMDLVHGLERLLRPFNYIGLPSHDIALMISLALRFIPTFMLELQKIKEAQISRGLDFGSGSIFKRLQKTAYLLTPLLLNAFRGADELADAMESRGYQRGSRTYLRELCFSRRDLAVAGLMVVMTWGFIFRLQILKFFKLN
ncbi:MAG: energy-coupling factor transporter transmembrane protein EcfT [Desulfobacteraceae bacterium]|nr:MAG: energy-coupling factor transporter transmembrane protein EcfT [Desulfobacteraceae bacterium]